MRTLVERFAQTLRCIVVQTDVREMAAQSFVWSRCTSGGCGDRRKRRLFCPGPEAEPVIIALPGSTRQT